MGLLDWKLSREHCDDYNVCWIFINLLSHFNKRYGLVYVRRPYNKSREWANIPSMFFTALGYPFYYPAWHGKCREIKLPCYGSKSSWFCLLYYCRPVCVSKEQHPAD